MVNRSLFRASWRFFTRHPWQLWLTLLSIALGTSVIVAVDLANQSAGTSFQRSVNLLSGAMTHEITATHGHIPDAFYPQLRVDWAYRASSPQVEVSLEANGLQYTLLGLDPFAGLLQNDLGANLPIAALTQLLTQPGTVVLPAKLATRLAAKTGDTLTFLHAAEPVELTVVAIADLPNAGDQLMLTDIATAQSIRTPDTPANSGLTRIQLKLTEAEATTLQTRLPAQLKLTSFAERQQVFNQMTQAFSTNLLSMSLLAMLVGAFLVYNTMTFSVLQRRQSFAIGRMVGITGQQLFLHLLLEALLLGLLGSTLGVLLGILLGQGLLVLVTQTMSDLFIHVNVTDLLISPLLVVKSVGITLLAVLAATLAPALEAARIPPVQVQRVSSLEQGGRRLSIRLALGGLLLMVASQLLIDLGTGLVSGFIGLFLQVLAYGLCIPLVLRGVLSTLQRWPLLQGSLLPRMAVRSVQASLSRTSLAIIALSIAVSATVGVSIMIGSFRHSVADWLETTLSSDLYISSVAAGDSRPQGTLNPDWVQRLQTLPQISSISTGRTTRLAIDGFPLPVLVLQPGKHSARGFEFLDGDPTLIWQQFLRGEGLLVSEPFAYHQQKQVGDTVHISTELAGKIALPILGIFRDYSATQGMLTLPRTLYDRYWQDHSLSSIGIGLATATDADSIQQQLESWANELQQPGEPLMVRSNQEIRVLSLQIFDRTFVITNVLRLLVIMVAFVGVFSALMALFLEKGREFAILRATGFAPRQLQVWVLWQAALIGLLAGLLALPLGWMMSSVLIDIINQRSFGWTIQTYFFAMIPLQAIGLALLAALLASIYPVQRIGRLSIKAGLQC